MTTAASWSGSPKKRAPRPLQVNTRAPSRRARREELPQVLVGRRGVADLELHGRADLDQSPTAIAPTSRSAPRTLRIRKSPRLKSALCSSTTRPRCRPFEASARSSGGSGAHALDQPVERGLAAELVEDVALGLGDGERLADRAAALGDDRARSARAGSSEHADRAVGDDLVVEHQPVAARARAADAMPPMTARPGRARRASCEEPRVEHDERVGQEQQRAALGGVRERGGSRPTPSASTTSSRPDGSQPDGDGRRQRRRDRPTSPTSPRPRGAPREHRDRRRRRSACAGAAAPAPSPPRPRARRRAAR